MIETLSTDLKKQILQCNFFSSDESKEKFLSLLKPCFRINYNLSSDENIELGASKVGGLPDMPFNIDWPKYNDHYLTFFCQLNLADIKSEQLPDKGIIYFFVWAVPNYSYSGKKESCRIIYTEDTNNLRRLDFPGELDPRSKFAPSTMHFYESVSYPDDESAWLRGLFDEVHQQGILYEQLKYILEGYHGSKFTEDKVLGYDFAIQDSAQGYWPIGYLGIKTWKEVDERKDEIGKIWGDFVLLLQMDIYCVPSKLAAYGGSPAVYFGIRKQDLASRKFENTVLTFQDT